MVPIRLVSGCDRAYRRPYGGPAADDGLFLLPPAALVLFLQRPGGLSLPPRKTRVAPNSADGLLSRQGQQSGSADRRPGTSCD